MSAHDYQAELDECDGSASCPAKRHPPSCLRRRRQDREIERQHQGEMEKWRW